MIKKYWFEFSIAVLAVFATVARFFYLSDSPPGFYVDEAAISAQVICLRQSGYDLQHHFFPLFSEVLGGGFATAPYMYLGALWTSLWGDSVSAFRGFTAFFSLLTVIGVGACAHAIWNDRRVALLCTLCAAISPWGFILARVAWDPALAPCFLVWGFYFGLRDTSHPIRSGVLAGWMLALACYAYPPTRVQVVLILPILILLNFTLHHGIKKRLLGAVPTFAILMLPLVIMTLSGELQGRFNMLSIFNRAYLVEHGGATLSNEASIFVGNILSHFSPRFLVFSGDANLRHSTGKVGVWSLLDLAAFTFFIVILVRRRTRFSKTQWIIFISLFAAWIAGVTPASMTWESNPHALRSIGAWPFIALLSGWLLFQMQDRQVRFRFGMQIFILAVAVWFMKSTGDDYFTAYPQRAKDWFDTGTIARIQDGEHLSEYPELARDYFLLHQHQMRCKR